jgi:hypothetical protein
MKLIGAMVVTFMLAVPFRAEATCAWVLWQEHRRAGTSWQERPFFFERAWTTREECEKRREAADAIGRSPTLAG